MKKLLLLAAAAILSCGPALAQAPGSGVPPGVVSGNTNVPSYSAAVHNFGNSSAGDILCVGGSATKTVKIKGLRVSAIASAAINSAVSIVRRSTLDSGGTPTSVTPVPNDPLNSAATATVTAYATAPTAGTLVGRIRAQKLAIGTATSTALAPSPALFQFSVYWDQPITLRSATQALCIDVDATAGGNWEVDAEFTEE
jgi:hypothetical protein